MSRSGTLVLAPTRRRLEARLAALYPGLSETPLRYPGQAGTRHGAQPPGYHHLQRGTDVGTGQDDFRRAAEYVRAWGTHRGSGLRVYPDDAPQQTGSTVLVAIRMGPVAIIAPCRVVWTVDEPARSGFGYGTLPGHPEEGEEAFVVDLDEGTGRVRFTVTAFSRPSAWYTRLGGPLNRVLQSRAVTGYLRSVRSAPRRPGPPP